MRTDAYPGPRPDRATAQRNRDAALARLTRVRAVTIAGAGVLTAAVAGVVSSASGHTLGKRPATDGHRDDRAPGRRPASRRGQAMPPLASARQLGLRRPSSAPGAGTGAARQPASPSPTQPQATQPRPRRSLRPSRRSPWRRRWPRPPPSRVGLDRIRALRGARQYRGDDGDRPGGDSTRRAAPSSRSWRRSITPAHGSARTPSCRRSTGPAAGPGGCRRCCARPCAPRCARRRSPTVMSIRPWARP